MEFEALKKYLFAKPGAKLEFPFGPDTIVYKVMGKMFILISWQSDPLFISIKTEPELGEKLREKYPSIKRGYHLNKNHWSTITLDNSIPDDKVYKLIDMSYDRVVEKLPRRLKSQLEKIRLQEEP